MQGGSEFKGHSRRHFLATLVLGLGALTFLASISRFLGRRRPTPLVSELPGEGSIFQPRRDARLEAWERQRKARG